ncbi:C-type mannose receptor 2-like [Siniperca chuatsi]|uniref:C-type mannose receptor 2-like n=1 Tax=Siniperca chuatsi TaxID=119488 RepID=UPI001CE07647|nr:C-type mannose receptor 2-like [Siniperca chuatsi]
MNWTDAQHYCRVKHADLATIGSMDDMSRLKRPNMDTSVAWIGLNDDPKYWKEVMGNDTNSWRWSATGTTSKTGYHNWQSGQPNYFKGKQTCVLADMNGSWDDEDCYLLRDFVCYTATNPTGQKTYTVIDIKMMWKDAWAYCRRHHTDLAMIENVQENTKMLSITSARVVWIGLYRVPWRWSDKSSISFTNWASGQPDGDQYCVAETSGHLMYDNPCNLKLSFFCNGVKMTVVRMKIQTDADLSDSATNAQVLQQLGANGGLTNAKLKWKIQSRKMKPNTKTSIVTDNRFLLN